eukprot:m.64132 g.64132  ORF g.64132 m.64132 type:complete len:376 (+) comp8102_c0_seq1:268-1395(+)
MFLLPSHPLSHSLFSFIFGVSVLSNSHWLNIRIMTEAKGSLLKGVLETVPDVAEIGKFKDEQEPVMFRTQHGDIQYIIQGTLEYEGTNQLKTPIITYHDAGLDFRSSFQALLTFPSIEVMMESFFFVHIHAPGQEPGAKPLPKDFVYPTLDELAIQVLDVVDHLNTKSWVGIGVGAGGNILLRASMNQDRCKKLRGLLLVGTYARQMGWFEYIAYNYGVLQLPMNTVVNEYMESLLLDNYFSDTTQRQNIDMMDAIRTHLRSNVNPQNLYAFLSVIMRRTDLMKQLKKSPPKTSILLVSGNDSIHLSDIEALFGVLDSSRSSYIKLNYCGNLATEEKPKDVLRAFVLFLQGINLGSSAVLKMNQLFIHDFGPSDD